MRHGNLVIKERVVTALLARDRAALKEFVAGSLLVTEPELLPFGGQHRGIDAYMALLDRIERTIRINSVEQFGDFFSADENELIFGVHLSGVHVTSGKPFATNVLEHWKFADGKVSEITPYWFDVPLGQ